MGARTPRRGRPDAQHPRDTQAYYGRMVKARDLAGRPPIRRCARTPRKRRRNGLPFRPSAKWKWATRARAAGCRTCAGARPGRDVRVLSALALAAPANRPIESYSGALKNPNPATPSSRSTGSRDRSVDGDRATCARPRVIASSLPCLRTRQSFSGNRRHIASAYLRD